MQTAGSSSLQRAQGLQLLCACCSWSWTALSTQKRGQQQVLKDLLPVFDNLERAAQHADTAADAKAVADGVRIVLKQFETTLERMGIKRVPTVGVAFDPALHEAIQHVESPDQPAGVVLHEVQAGYTIGDMLLRAAMVVVSKGSAKGEVLPS